MLIYIFFYTVAHLDTFANLDIVANNQDYSDSDETKSGEAFTGHSVFVNPIPSPAKASFCFQLIKCKFKRSLVVPKGKT